jgi:hypothetical protein
MTAMRWLPMCVLAVVSVTVRGDELRTGGDYGPGVVVQISTTGVSFRVPPGWRALYPPTGGETILLRAEQGQGRGIFTCALGVESAQLQEEMAAEKWVAEGVTLAPAGAVREGSGRLRADYRGPEGTVGRGLGIVPGGGRAALAVLAGPAAEARRLEAALTAIADAVEFGDAPEAAELRSLEARLRGSRLHSTRLRTSDDYAETRHIVYDLCRDGAFSLLATIEASAPGKDGLGGVKLEPRTTDEAQGRWRLIERLGRRPTLMFTSAEGVIAYQPLVVNGGEILLDGRPTTLEASQECQ